MSINSHHASLQIEANIRAHDRIAKRYERIHGEIYNEVEQARLRGALKRALSEVGTKTEKKVALDFGCGAGNLTRHLSFLGLDVLACDVSQGFLNLVASRTHETRVETIKINGNDLSNIADDSVDMVATYSVLHHVPDYLRVLSEFVRVLKPGGVVFIDHEVSAEVWVPTPERLAFLEEMSVSVGWWWRKYFRLENYVNWFIRKFVNPRYSTEGDIHVFVDDHIEWDRVAAQLMKYGAEIVIEDSYLLFKRGYDFDVYRKHADRTKDTQLIVARKL